MKPTRTTRQTVALTERQRTKQGTKTKAAQTAAQTYIRKSLGRAMKRFRQDAGITQQDLAKWLDLGQGNVSRYERGLQWVESSERLIAVASALRVPLWVLILAAEHDDESPETIRDAMGLVHQFLAMSDVEQRRLLNELRTRRETPKRKRRP